EGRRGGGVAGRARAPRTDGARAPGRGAARARRHRTRHGALTAAVVAVCLAVVVVAGTWAVDTFRSGRPEPAGRATGNAAIAGAYARTIGGADPTAAADHMAGRWAMSLLPSGRMNLTPPPAFEGVLSGTLFRLAGGRFRTDLFAQDLCTSTPLGTYTWTRTGGLLRFAVVDDPCGPRAALLASGPWT